MAAVNQVRPADIEAKLREIKGEVRESADKAAPVGIAVGVAAVVVLVGAAYLMGRRRGRKRSTVVEIRRM